MKEKIIGIIKPTVLTILFLGIFVVLFMRIQNIFELKGSGYGKYTYFSAEEDDSLDIIYFGNSRLNRAVDPLIVDEITGLRSFNLGIQGLRTPHVYARMEEAYKEQSPKLVVIDASVCIPASDDSLEDSYLHRALDSLPDTLSKAKLAIELGETKEQKLELVLSLLRFHSRYKEIDSVDYLYSMTLNEDFDYENSYSEEIMATHRGYTAYPTDKSLADSKKNYFKKDYSTITEIAELDEDTITYFDKCIQLAKENGSKVLIISIPAPKADGNASVTVPIMNYFRSVYGDDSDIEILDLTLCMDDIGLNYANYQNTGHVNVSGCELISNYLGGYIKANYNLN